MTMRSVEMTARSLRVRSTVGMIVRSDAARMIAAGLTAARTAAARAAATTASLWRGGN
jgi:hypothetical protein